MRRLKLLSLALILSSGAFAQKQWTLRECIVYAVENNINIRERRIEIESDKIQLNTARMSRLPNIEASAGQNFNFGRSTGIDNITSDYSSATSSLQAYASMPLFTGGRISNQIKMKKFDIKASVADLENAREDIAINVTGYFLQMIYNIELTAVSMEQVKLSEQQVEVSRLLVKSGKAAESELYESEAQLAQNRLNYTESVNNLTMARLELAQLLNLEDYADFDIKFSDQDVSMIDFDKLPSVMSVYANALESRPSIAAAKYRIASSEKSLRISKSAYYPSLSLGAGYSNSYFYNYNLPDGVENLSFNDQIKNNGSQSIGITLSVPVFNRFATRNSVRESRLRVEAQKLQLQNARQNLLKEIQQAYANATASRDKYLSARKSVEASDIAYRYEEKKFNAGRSTSFDLNGARVRLEQSKSEELQSYYQYMFRVRILEFYDGKPIL